jgi:hypothetical protein
MNNVEAHIFPEKPSRALEYGLWVENEIKNGGRIVSIRQDGSIARIGEEPGTPIDVLGFPNYIKSRLIRKGVKTVEQLEVLDERSLRFGFVHTARGFGNVSLRIIREALVKHREALHPANQEEER